MFSTAIIFDRRGVADGDKDGTLEVRITIERKSYYINTGIRVRRKHWAGAVVNRPDADALNNRLGIVVKRVNEKVNEFIDKRQPIDVNAIKDFIYSGTTTNQDRMIEWFKEQIPTMNVSDGTRKHYWLLYDRLSDYGKLRSWSDLTVESIYEWDAWLHQNIKAKTRKNEPERNIGDGTVWNYHKHLKALINRAVTFGVVAINPYDRLTGKFNRGEVENVEYLTEEQMQLILNTHPIPGSQMEDVRDLFVFQLFTGLSYSDAQNFDIKNYHEEGDVYVANGQRIKTGVAYVSVLLYPVVDVLKRHDWKVPHISNIKYNGMLKTFGSVIGIDGMHSHLARHSFATWMLSNDAKIQNLMRMLGHKNIRTTMRYAKVLAKDVREDYESAGEKLNFKNNKK